MQNLIIILGAVMGIVLGGWFAHWMFSGGSGADSMVTILTGAIPGTLVGAYIAFKLSTRET